MYFIGVPEWILPCSHAIHILASTFAQVLHSQKLRIYIVSSDFLVDVNVAVVGALFCLQPFTMTHKWLSFLSTTTNTPLGYVGKSVFSWRWCAASVVEVRRPRPRRRRGRLNEATTSVRCDPRNTFRSWLFMNLQIPWQQHTRGCASGRFPSFRQSDCQSVSERVSQSGSQLV